VRMVVKSARDAKIAAQECHAQGWNEQNRQEL